MDDRSTLISPLQPLAVELRHPASQDVENQSHLKPSAISPHLFHKAKGPPGNRATLSMGGSSNGGKAIRTLWCKSRCGSYLCQESFQKNASLAFSITYTIYSENFRFSPAFYRTLVSPANQPSHHPGPDSPPHKSNRGALFCVFRCRLKNSGSVYAGLPRITRYTARPPPRNSPRSTAASISTPERIAIWVSRL